VELHNATTKTDEWAIKGTLTKRWGGMPPSCSGETVGIVGYGGLGKRIQVLAKGLGMKVLVAERKAIASTPNRADRTSFADILSQATVIVICCPRDPSTIDLIEEAELKQMRREAIIINVARGRIVNEAATVKALREGLIAGYATDVFADEPAKRGESPLLPLEADVPGLIVSPHVAWFAGNTITNLQAMLKENLETFANGSFIRRVV